MQLSFESYLSCVLYNEYNCTAYVCPNNKNLMCKLIYTYLLKSRIVFPFMQMSSQHVCHLLLVAACSPSYFHSSSSAPMKRRPQSSYSEQHISTFNTLTLSTLLDDVTFNMTFLFFYYLLTAIFSCASSPWLCSSATSCSIKQLIYNPL